MTMNDDAKNDLLTYRKITTWSSLALVVAISIGMVLAKIFAWENSYTLLTGGLFGVILAVANVFAIGYSFYVLAIKNGRRWVLLVPISTFLAMCGAAYLLTSFAQIYLFGFAIGLTSPVLLATSIVYLSMKPA